MTPDDLAAAYPDCPNAVAWCEADLFSEPWGTKIAKLLLFGSMESTVQSIRRVVAVILENNPTAQLQAAHAEMALPSFRRYLAGRLGLV